MTFDYPAYLDCFRTGDDDALVGAEELCQARDRACKAAEVAEPLRACGVVEEMV